MVCGLGARRVVINGTSWEGKTTRNMEEDERCAAAVKITGAAAHNYSELMVCINS